MCHCQSSKSKSEARRACLLLAWWQRAPLVRAGIKSSSSLQRFLRNGGILRIFDLAGKDGSWESVVIIWWYFELVTYRSSIGGSYDTHYTFTYQVPYCKLLVLVVERSHGWVWIDTTVKIADMRPSFIDVVLQMIDRSLLVSMGSLGVLEDLSSFLVLVLVLGILMVYLLCCICCGRSLCWF